LLGTQIKVKWAKAGKANGEHEFWDHIIQVCIKFSIFSKFICILTSAFII